MKACDVLSPFRQFFSTFFRLILPFACLILLVKTTSMGWLVPDAWHTTLFYMPLFLWLVAALLSWRFMKSNRIFIALVMGLFYGVLLSKEGSVHLPAFWEALSWTVTAELLSWLPPLLSINLLFFALAKERGFWSFWGRLKMGLLLAQGGFLFFLASWPPHWLHPLLQWTLPWSLPHQLFSESVWMKPVTAWLHLPHFSLLMMGAVILILMGKLFLRPTLLLYTVLLTVLFLPLIPAENDALMIALSFSFTALLLILSVLHDSYEMAYLDQLTKIPSRRALEAAMLKLGGGTYSIAMLDIDFFKKFNDRHGHDTGDEVLAMVARTLAQGPGRGKVFRFGGEEFTILFPGQSLQQVKPQLEKLRLLVSQQRLKKKTGSQRKSIKRGGGKSTPSFLRVTISIGVAEKSACLTTPDMVRTAADKALYRAKKKGRNCVSV